jgi:hypothetical protein
MQMNTKTPTNDSNRNEPVSEEFKKFEKNYGGDAANAHDDRMDSILDGNAKEIDKEISSEDAKRASKASDH